MVSDLYLFWRGRDRNRERIVRAHQAAGAGTRHFRTDLNISSFDRNATPDRPNHELPARGGHFGTTLVISITCADYSLPNSSRMISTTRMTPPRPIPEWPMPYP